MKNHINCKLEDIFKSNKSFTDLFVLENLIFWIEPINTKEERINAIFVRPFNQKKSKPQNLTGEKFYIKNSFHGYGGKSYKCIQKEEKIYIFWIDQLSKSIWGQVFIFNNSENNNYLLPIEYPNKLTNKIEGNFDGCFCLVNKTQLFGLIEVNERDYLFSVNINEINQDLKIIKKFKNFAGDLSSNFSTNLLSWIEWGSPYMSWEKNDLYFAEIDAFGKIKKTKRFSNKFINEQKNVSFFQPHWISDELLVCSEDSLGWWNLLFIEVCKIENIVIKKRIKKKLFEYGTPQWVAGITFFSGCIKNLFCLAKKENTWILEQYQDLEFVNEFYLPFSSISDFSASHKKVVLKGYGSNFFGSLQEIDYQEKISSKILKEMPVDFINECSCPESIWFDGFDNQSTHAFIYRPLMERFLKPPLLIRAHSGPTSCFDGSYNSEVQYWTSKGFFVAEVNYGGSSGFGREYRERLNSKWGIVDSYDCNALVIALLKLDLVDINKIVIFGNSAGGLTAINCLYSGNFFKAAICKYPVLDLRDMYQNTHRFEKDYLNNLVGNYERFFNEYNNRSPIKKICKIKDPILLFHGKKDSVISYKQTLKIKEQIIQNNKYSEVILFENEGHGFRNIETKTKVIEKSEEFLSQALNI